MNLLYHSVICIHGRCKSSSLRVYICYETQQSFPSNISRKKVLLVLTEPSELWTNCSFYGMFPVILFCLPFFYLVQESNDFSLIEHFLREYQILVISHPVWILAWVFFLSGNSPVIDWLMDKLISLLMSGFSWLAGIITPGHPILGKLGPKGALPRPSVPYAEVEHCSSLTM